LIGERLNPPRCGGLACVALSGRRKHIILHYLNDYKIDRHFLSSNIKILPNHLRAMTDFHY
ncbi:MAG: hypothetical protein LBP87_10505, partial [Planctomycetaceae bacterium]|nr:hypothetical protein [Planctomycetaceae bacterium]